MPEHKHKIETVRIVEYDNQDIVVGKYPFTTEDMDRPELAAMRDRYDLDKVAGRGSEFERQVALRCWRATRHPHGNRVTEEAKQLWKTPWNGLYFLKAAEMGCSFTCPVASMTYIQLCLAMGWPARLVEICQAGKEWIPPTEHNCAHTVSEVWSNDYRKWVLMDADCNLHYSRDGIPLSALDVHDAWVRGQADAVELVQGEPPFHSDGSLQSDDFDEPVEMKRFFANRVMDYYHEVRITLRNNHLSRPVLHADHAQGWFPQLVWVDPGDQNPMIMRTGRLRPYVHYSGVRQDFDWTLNQAHIEIESGDTRDVFSPTSKLRVNLTTVTPWFSHYEVRLDNADWVRMPSTFVLDGHPGVNRIQARPVNRYGTEGIVSTVAVELSATVPG